MAGILRSIIKTLEKVTGTKISVTRENLELNKPGIFRNIYIPKADLTMHLELHQSLDQMYNLGIIDTECLDFIKPYLGSGKVFLDIGANQGFYSCWVLKHVPGSKVVAFEPDPYSIGKFEKNIELNHLEKSDYLLNKHALSDKEEAKPLMLNTVGNRAGSSLVIDQKKWQKADTMFEIEVPCYTLFDSLQKANINHIDAMKLDIEGLEYPVLRKFFEDAPASLYPKAIVVEAVGNCIDLVGGTPIELLINKGYELKNHVECNFLFALKN